MINKINNHSKYDILIFAIVIFLLAVLAALRLFDPFDGDQALFLLGGRMLDAGAVLYRDFWDIKQPGIFWFYELAGRFFGFTQSGIRLFELCWMLAFGIVLILTLRRILDNGWLAIVAPIAFLTTYFGYASFWELTQVESIAPFAIYVAAFFLSKDYRNRTGQTIGFAIAGALAAVAVVFKIAFALIFFPLVALAIARQRQIAGRSLTLLGDLWRLGMSFSLGVGVVLACVTLLFVAQGAIEPFLWTMFVFPVQMLGDNPTAPLHQLLDLAAEGASRTWPWLLLALPAAMRCVARREPPITLLMVAWAVTAGIVIVLQKWSWWNYHLPLVFAPVSVLAARGMDLLYTRLHTLSQVVHIAPALALLLMAPGILISLFPVWERTSLLLASFHENVPVEVYRRRLSNNYDWIGKDVAFLAAAPAGSIYVVGSPVVYILSGRTQAGAIHGWAWGIMPDAIWKALPVQIASTRPQYIYLDAAGESVMRSRHPEIVDKVLEDYCVYRRSQRGTWHIRRAVSDTDKGAVCEPPETPEAGQSAYRAPM